MNKAPRFSGERAVGFLLAQVGACAASAFADRLAPLGLKPSDAGILRLLGQDAGLSQQQLAVRLRMHATRLVSVVDDLEARGLVQRQANAEDRRSYALYLTDKGRSTLGQIQEDPREHNESMCAGLSQAERDGLAALLARIAEQQGLTPGVHPGYRHLPAAAKPPSHHPGRR